jgi:hypothetical protein
VGAELFHADRRTDMTKLIVAFYSFSNAPKNATRKGCALQDTKLALEKMATNVNFKVCKFSVISVRTQ